jgi:NAD(P)-dependent dehydrogenase (short-subunit alcohol dehydrogenase family)
MADIVMITGGSGGIGAATAARLTTAGTRVVLVAREPERLAAQAAALGVPWLASDVLDPAGLGAAIERIEAEHGAIAGLVHAVGSIVLRPLHTLSLEDWHRTLDLNVTSAFNALKAVLPKMMRRRRGRVVLFSSVAAQTGLPNHEAISAAKGAVEALVRSAAVGYARYGIRVNAIAPALIRTELSRTLWESEAADVGRRGLGDGPNSRRRRRPRERRRSPPLAEKVEFAQAAGDELHGDRENQKAEDAVHRADEARSEPQHERSSER